MIYDQGHTHEATLAEVGTSESEEEAGIVRAAYETSRDLAEERLASYVTGQSHTNMMAELEAVTSLCMSDPDLC